MYLNNKNTYILELIHNNHLCQKLNKYVEFFTSGCVKFSKCFSVDFKDKKKISN